MGLCCSAWVWGQSPAQQHIPTPRGPSTSEARCSPEPGRGIWGLLSGRPICLQLQHLALVTPGEPCLRPPGPVTVPQGTCQGLREGVPGPHWLWVPAFCLPRQTLLWAPAPSLCPRQWAPGAASPSSPKKQGHWAELFGDQGGHVLAAAGAATSTGLAPRRGHGGPGPQAAVVGSWAPQGGQSLGKGSDPSCGLQEEGRTQDRW